jgi:hypothetical protein
MPEYSEGANVMERHISRLALAVGLAVGCPACGSESPSPLPPASDTLVGGQTGGEAGIRCSSTTSVTSLDFAADSPLGFSGSDVMAAAPADGSKSLSWSDGSSATLLTAVGYAGRAGYAASCRSNAVDVILHLSTSDGALAETIPARLFASAVDTGMLDAELAFDTLGGTLASVHPTLVDASAHLLVQLSFQARALSGRVLRIDSSGSTAIAAF